MLSVYIIKVDLLIVVGKKNHNNIPKAVKLYFFTDKSSLVIFRLFSLS